MGMANQLSDPINEANHLFLRLMKESGINQLELIFEETIVNEAKRGKVKSTYSMGRTFCRNISLSSRTFAATLTGNSTTA